MRVVAWLMLAVLLGVSAAKTSSQVGQVPAHGPALNSPECLKAPEAKNEQNGDEVLGVGRNGEFCAYPLRLIAHHRVVNDHLGGPPIVIAYDPDSAAGAVYDPTADGRALTFDADGARNAVPIIRDRVTGTAWSLLTGEALEGPLQGRKLARIPSLILTWQYWKVLHPSSWVLKEDPARNAHYVARTTPAAAVVPAENMSTKIDRRLAPDSLVLGVVIGDRSRAYEISQLDRGSGVVYGTLGDRRIVVFNFPAARTCAAYEVVGTEANPNPVFHVRDAGAERVFFVQAPYTAFNIEGTPLSGHSQGIRGHILLRPIPFVRCRWYAWSAAFPKTDIARIPKLKTSMASFRGALVNAAGFDTRQAKLLVGEDYNAVAFDLSGGASGAAHAARAARTAGLSVYGWIQVGRDEKAARLHPEWLHAPQHSEWLQATDHSIDRAVDHTVFQDTGSSLPRDTPASNVTAPVRGYSIHSGDARVQDPTPNIQDPIRRHGHNPTESDRYAVSPWVCVNNRAVFAYEAMRVQRTVEAAPNLDGLFLCDIQGPPMGCGCGNPLCRSWDNSPGEKVAPAPYQHPDLYFSKEFVASIERDNPGLLILPVLCEECENGIDVGPASNPDLLGPCHNVPCAHPCSLDYYPGLLRAFAGARPMCLLAFYRLFGRNNPEYGGEAAWITGILQRVHQTVLAQPIIAVLQGWSGSQAQRALQKQRALEGGATGYLMALVYVKQSWEAKKRNH